jgi:cell division protein FtsL
MSEGTNDKGISDLEREFEEEVKKEKSPKEGRLPEEIELEREYDEEMKGERLPEEKELDPIAKRFYELSNRTFKTETELDDAVNRIVNDLERDYFFKGLLKKTKRGGQLLLKKGLETFKGFSAFQAASGITELARGSLKGTLGTLAKAGLRGARVGAIPSALQALGFEAGKERTRQNRDAWQNFANVCKESFDYLAKNLTQNADDPLEASRLAAEAFSTALKKVKSERQRAYTQETRKTVEKAGPKKFVSKTAILALGVICIVLAAGLVGAIFVYTPRINNLQSQITEKNSTISSLNTMISSLNSTISSLNNMIFSLNQTNQTLQNTVNQLELNVSNLQLDVAYLNNITLLNASAYLLSDQALSQAAGASTIVFENPLSFAGYVSVGVQSTSNTTYVGVAYYSYGITYNNNVTVGTGGTAAFPILGGATAIIVGNKETVNSVNATVTATYYY